MVGRLWEKSIGAGAVLSTDLELLDEGQQTKFVHVHEGFGPMNFLRFSPR